MKLFSRYSGYGKEISKTTSYEGYYAGLDEAVSLLSLGLECVYLWHVIVLPLKSWAKYLDYGKNFFQKIVSESQSLSILGTSWLSLTIEYLEIPVGFISTHMLIGPKEQFLLLLNKQTVLGAELNPMSQEEPEPLQTRKLLLDSFNVEGVRISMPKKFCPRCNEDFGVRVPSYVFCPLCGAQLEEKTSLRARQKGN